MVKEIQKFSESEQMLMLLQGTSYAMYEAGYENKIYNNYKEGKEIEVSKSEMEGLKILSLLDNLGYPMDELGTYLYKDVIIKLCDLLKDISTRRDMEKCSEILEELNNCYSCFYHGIAREDKEIGVKTFHLYIKQAVDKIDEEKIDKELVKSIYGNELNDMNYGLNAFLLAAYSLEKYSYVDVEEYKKPLIKKVANLPENLKLKDNN